MDKYIKRLQTRASRKGISVSKSQIRAIYETVVTTPENPSEEEMLSVISTLETQYQAPSYEVSEGDLTIPEPQVVEITPQDHPDVLEALQPPAEQSSPIQQQEEPQQMTPAQPTLQTSDSALTTSNSSAISQSSSADLSVTQQQIQEAVEQQFGKENIETKTVILNYVAQDTFATAQELQTALGKLRQMRLEILMKLINDHNSQSSSDEDLLKNALRTATANRQRESEDFFGSFENQLLQMRATFGV